MCCLRFVRLCYCSSAADQARREYNVVDTKYRDVENEIKYVLLYNNVTQLDTPVCYLLQYVAGTHQAISILISVILSISIVICSPE